MIRIVSFATIDYAVDILKMQTSARAFGLDVRAVAMPEMSWEQAVAHKPVFIAEQLAALPDEYEGLLWTDADSRFLAVPKWEEFTAADVACHQFQRTPGHLPEFLTGTLWFRNSAFAKAFTNDWVEETAHHGGDTPEQDSLRACYARWQNRIKFADFGPGMVYISDTFREHYPGVKPVIVHFQRSRERRGKA